MRRVRWWEVTVSLGLFLVLFGALCFPIYPDGHPPPKATMCLSNVKRESLGLVMYSGDENDRLALRDRWMDSSQPYVKQKDAWYCPSASKGAYGYAYNAALSGIKEQQIVDPEATPMIYDSVNPIRNASDLCASLPLPGRHGQKEDGGANTVSYADGHAKPVHARPVVH